MSRLEDLTPNSSIRGILPNGLVTVVNVQWHGSAALELTYKTPEGKVANELLYRHDEPRIEVVGQGRPWSFDGDGALFRLVSEAQRIRLAHLFDPVLAVHTSIVEPLPHQITAVYESMLPRQPLRFLLADDPGAGKTIMAGLLMKATRRYLAWESILTEKVTLNLDPQQVKQAETQKSAADGVVTARLPETYQWLLAPGQTTPQAAVEWQAIRLSGQDPLAGRASKKLRSEELLLTSFAGTRLRMELDRVPLWRGDHVATKQLVQDFARYLYLPRIKEPAVLLQSIRDGLGLLTWSKDSFAFAEGYDDAAARYRGLRCGQIVAVSLDDMTSLLVKPEAAQNQIDTETATASSGPTSGAETVGPSAGVHGGKEPGASDGPSSTPTKPERFHGSVALDATRVGRDAGRVADEVIAHLAGLVGSSVKVTLEIEADISAGVPENVVRTVTENSRTLKFSSYGFEQE